MTGLGALGYYLWIAPHVLQVVLLAILWRGKLLRVYPMFGAYTLISVLQTALLFYVSRLDPQLTGSYLPLYLVGMALSTALRFGIIAEIMGDLFREYPALVQPGKWLLRGAAGLLVMVAVGLAAAQPGNWTDSLKLLTYGVDRAASILQAGLLLVLLAFSRYLGIAWRNQSFGIALGLGIFATTELAVSALRLNVDAQSAHFFDLVTMAVYHCCVLVWIGYMLIPEAASAAGKPPEDNLQAWNEELERMLQP
jgi:hypothetical protein